MVCKIAECRISNNRALLAIPIILLGAVVFLAWNLWRNMEDAGYESCISSIAGQLHIRLEGDLVEPITIVKELPNDRSWKVLSNLETEMVLDEIQAGDCGKINDITSDPWGEKVNIALRKFENRIEGVIWSNGADGRVRTSDDIVTPHGREIPR